MKDEEIIAVHPTSRSATALGDEEELFRRHHLPLVRTVGRAVNAPAELVEDACQNAWLVLLRRQPERTPALFAWLRTVALHQAYRLWERERREASLEAIGGDAGWESAAGAAPSIETALDARRALARMAELPDAQRRDLALLIGGFSYREIARRGGRPRSVNNVNKHLTKARARLRTLDIAA
jgi:RNA polymerase sigma factor (sigma-70 family)